VLELQDGDSNGQEPSPTDNRNRVSQLGVSFINGVYLNTRRSEDYKRSENVYIHTSSKIVDFLAIYIAQFSIKTSSN
jgi:hypothetical protein